MSANCCAQRTRRTKLLFVGLIVVAVVDLSLWGPPAFGQAADPNELRTLCFGGKCEAPEPVDIFALLEQQSLTAQMIVRDPYHARLILTNRSNAPLSVQLPDALAARPILAQMGNNIFGQPTPSNRSSAQAPQTVGGTPMSSSSSNRGNNNNGFQNFFNPNNMNNVFNIAPEQVRTIEVRCLCLEQGKPNPHSAVKYELVKLSEVNDDPRLAEVLRANARGEVTQEVAQAAAWHIANEMSWDELAGLTQRIALNAERPWFHAQQLQQAKRLVDGAKQTVAKSPQTKVIKQAIVLPKL